MKRNREIKKRTKYITDKNEEFDDEEEEKNTRGDSDVAIERF